jgi:hypothetical protein
MSIAKRVSSLAIITGCFFILMAVGRSQDRLDLHPSATVSWTKILEAGSIPTVPLAPNRMVHRPLIGPGPRGIGAQNDAGKPAEATSSIRKYQGVAGISAPPSLSFEAIPDNNFLIPPDVMGAVGPSHVMTMLNSETRIQDKSGSVIATLSTQSFWTGATGLSGSVFDPKLMYDALSGRWIAAIDADSRSATSSVFFAISGSDDPTGSWTFYSIDSDPSNLVWSDFPGFGCNGTWIVITNNMFTVSASAFVGVKMWVIDKSTVLSGSTATVTTFNTGFDLAGGIDGFTLQPVQALDTSSALYLIDNSGVYRTSDTTFLLRISMITGTGSSPSWSVLPGSVFTGSGLFAVPNNFNWNQVDAQQSGDTVKIETNDIRALNAVYRNGRIWCSHSAGLPAKIAPTPNRTAVFWYQINPAATPAPIVHSGVIDGGAGVHYFFPSVTANSRNDMCIGFTRSDATRFPEGVVTGRLAGDASGTVRPIEVVKTGESSYSKFFGGSRNRWGDYTATVVDPSDDLTFWTIQEYARPKAGTGRNDGRWGTWWAMVEPDVVLPIQLLSLGATVQPGNAVRLEWSTMSETNNYGFYIERRREEEQEFMNPADNFIPGQGTSIEPRSYVWTDEILPAGTYRYRLRQVDLDGLQEFSYEISVTVGEVLAVGSDNAAPFTFALGQNYPNPFNPSTSIEFTLPEAGETTLKMYNSLGQEVALLVDGHLQAGRHSIRWNAGDLPSGTYTCRLTSVPSLSGSESSLTRTRRVLLIK